MSKKFKKKKDETLQKDISNAKKVLLYGGVEPELTRAYDGFREVVRTLADMGYSTKDQNFTDTAIRATRAFHEMIWPTKRIEQEIEIILSAVFRDQGERYDSMVVSTQNIVTFVCPHHLLPVSALVHLAYIPAEGKKSRILGISKLTRLAQILAKQPILQETYTANLAYILHTKLGTFGTGVMTEGIHSCMSCRGVKSPTTRITTTTVLGSFQDDGAIKNEFIERINATRNLSVI